MLRIFLCVCLNIVTFDKLHEYVAEVFVWVDVIVEDSDNVPVVKPMKQFYLTQETSKQFVASCLTVGLKLLADEMLIYDVVVQKYSLAACASA